MPGARCLKTVTTISTATASAETSVKVIICAQMSARLPGEYSGSRQGHIGEPADIRTDIQHEGDPDHEPAEHVDPIAEGVEAREGDVARADHQRNKIDRESLHTGTANRNIIVVPCMVKSWL